jgi:hypothetical protein
MVGSANGATSASAAPSGGKPATAGPNQRNTGNKALHTINHLTFIHNPFLLDAKPAWKLRQLSSVPTPFSVLLFSFWRRYGYQALAYTSHAKRKFIMKLWPWALPAINVAAPRSFSPKPRQCQPRGRE